MIPSKKNEKNTTLIYVLELIENCSDVNVEHLCWSILFLYILGYTYDPYSKIYIASVDEFEDTIRNTKGGYKLKWNELKDLCGRFENIVDCSIVGSRSNEEIDYIADKCGNDFDANFKMNHIGIHILDGYMEEFCSKDKNLEQIVHDDTGPFPISIRGNI